MDLLIPEWGLFAWTILAALVFVGTILLTYKIIRKFLRDEKR